MGGIIKGKHLGDFGILPPPKDTCQVCAVKHEPELPHNAQSMFYQYNFYNEHGRWPTWKDAIEHCDDAMKELWKKELIAKGVDSKIFEEGETEVSDNNR